MIPVGRIQVLALLAVASVGLMAGHSLTYLKLAPSHGIRTTLLGITGHGYLDKALAFVPALALMSALYWVAAGALKSRYGRPRLMGTALALALIQTLGFAAQEILERLVAGAPLHGLGSVLLVGVPLQLIVAGLGAILVTALHRAGRKIGALLGGSGPARQSTPSQPLLRTDSFLNAVPLGSLRTRGPPALSS
ncbi:hypothetical protein BH23ACT12_BH23ACT12_18230 [soil metagenome]